LKVWQELPNLQNDFFYMANPVSDCHICQRVQSIKNGNNPNLVKELTTGYAVIGDYQTFKGYSLFLSKYHASELHKLPKNIRHQFLEEMSLVAEAVYNCFQPYKLNYELLGNSDQHLHWHLFPSVPPLKFFDIIL